MDKVLDGFKTVLENFAKQTSLNILLFTGVITSGFIYWRTSNDVALYVALGCLIFLIMNLLVKYIPKWNEKRQEKRLTKRLNNPKWQKKILSSLDEYDLEVLQDLYAVYPDMKEYNSQSPVILKLQHEGMLIASDQLLPSIGIFNRMFALQPWVKTAMDNNREFIRNDTL